MKHQGTPINIVDVQVIKKSKRVLAACLLQDGYTISNFMYFLISAHNIFY